MALVNVSNIIVENNPAPFTSPLVFKITFECLKDIPDGFFLLISDIDWQIIYVGSAKEASKDQVLDTFSMGPLTNGVMQFAIETNPPNHKLIPSKEDLLGVTAVIITVSYHSKEFLRCGFYVYNCIPEDYIVEEGTEIDINKVERRILADKPRITRYDIEWEKSNEKSPENSEDKDGKTTSGEMTSEENKENCDDILQNYDNRH